MGHVGRPNGAAGSGIGSRRLGTRALLVAGILLIGALAGCSGSVPQSEPPDPAQMVDSGSWYVREAWPHDGHPYETAHFVVYSDGAGQEARQRLGTLAEQVWGEIIDEMGLDPATMFTFPAGQDKIDLYANRSHVIEGGGARAYYAGVIIASFDNEIGEPTSTATVRINLKHELVHVAEALLKGRFVGDVPVGDPRRMPVWFSEGTAEAISGGSTGGAPRTLDQVDELIAKYGRINPISWQVDIPFSDLAPGAYSNYYYPMAQLAVEYLLDPRGMGKSPADLAAVMRDMGDDVPFAEAFEHHVGISQTDYETRFFALMDAYLPQSEFPFEAAGLWLASLLAAMVMAGSVLWGLRRWPATASPSPASGPTWTRRARGVFIAEITATAGIAVLLVTRALLSIGLDDLPQDANRALAFGLTATFFVASSGILLWALRRGRIRSGRVSLIPLLVLAAAFVTTVLIDRII
jgi:hypothetical protein